LRAEKVAKLEKELKAKQKKEEKLKKIEERKAQGKDVVEGGVLLDSDIDQSIKSG
jgi:hypothetical protein